MTGTAAIVEARGLTKNYGLRPALDGLDLVAPAGAVTAVLGPNGAGKTTFVKTIATLCRPQSGVLRIAGIDALAEPAATRRLIGLAGQYAAVEPALTGRENLVMIARLFGHGRSGARIAAEAVLAQMTLSDDADRPVREYSGGMRRRLDLGASLVGAPRLLLLDEPTTGLDPGTRLDLWDAIRSLVANGTSVLLTTQYLEEADQLAEHIVIIDHGRAIASGTPADLKARLGRDVIEIRPCNRSDTAAIARLVAPLGRSVPHLDQAAGSVTLPVLDGPARLADALAVLVNATIELDEIGLRRPTLDEVFLTTTGATR